MSEGAGLGARIQELRTLSGLSSRELSRLAGLSPTHVRRIETGHFAEVSTGTIARIARVFGVGLDWLYLGTGKRPANHLVAKAVVIARGHTAHVVPSR
jgi:transcriptional regulator with XRE-family HTH domain